MRKKSSCILLIGLLISLLLQSFNYFLPEVNKEFFLYNITRDTVPDQVFFPTINKILPKVVNGKIVLIHRLTCGGIDNIPNRTLNVANFGAKGDSTDQTQYIQNALDTLDSLGGGTLYIPKGVYLLLPHGRSYCVSIPSNVVIEGDSTGTALFRRSNNDINFSNLFQIENSSNVIFKNITIDGNRQYQDSTFEHQNNIFVEYSSCLLFSNVTLENSVGDCLYFYYGSENAIVENCNIYNTKRSGINISNLASGQIFKCNFSNVYNGIKVEKDSPMPNYPSRDITISYCNFRSDSYSLGMYGVVVSGLNGDLAKNFTIEKNTFDNIGYGVIGLFYVDSIFVINNMADSVYCLLTNYSYNSGLGVINGYLLSDGNVTNNGMGRDTSIYANAYGIFYFKNAVFINDSFSQNSSNPYLKLGYIRDNENVTLTNNYISGTGSATGFSITNTSNFTFKYNTMLLNSTGNALELVLDSTEKYNSIDIENNSFNGSYQYAFGTHDTISSSNGSNVLFFNNNNLLGTYTGTINNIPSFFIKP